LLTSNDKIVQVIRIALLATSTRSEIKEKKKTENYIPMVCQVRLHARREGCQTSKPKAIYSKSYTSPVSLATINESLVINHRLRRLSAATVAVIVHIRSVKFTLNALTYIPILTLLKFQTRHALLSLITSKSH